MKKYLFLDRDGTLIQEPRDLQVDSIQKFALVPNVISSLKEFSLKGFTFVMVSNQDGLGTPGYPQAVFDEIQRVLLGIFESEAISFEEILICPHFEDSQCACRKPKTAMLFSYLARNDWDRNQSYFIGDRETDALLARNLGVASFLIGPNRGWSQITNFICNKPRSAGVKRNTSETEIEVFLELEGQGIHRIETGLGFFDHMLQQVAKHSGMNLKVSAKGDLHVDQHHLIEDVALAIGTALKDALGDKRGIARYGFWLPMDESSASATLDLSGRPVLVYEAEFRVATVGEIPVELFNHFFKSFCDAAGMALHLTVKGENGHHMVEGMFKVFGKALAEAIKYTSGSAPSVPSTKGIL